MTKIKFTKLHGNGNDFILIDEFDTPVPDDRKSAFAKKYCHRRFGIGADGVLFLSGSGRGAPLRMRIFNEDGSEAEMCGNGIRCFAKYTLDTGHIRPGKTKIETGAGVLEVEVSTNGKTSIKVCMGKPLFDRKKIPANGMGDFINVPLHGYEVSAVNTGVPHAVIFVDSLDDPDLMKIAPQIRYDKVFPKGINVNFAIREPGKLRVRTYERGVEGETLSCGTGSVAVAAVARHMGFIRDSAVVATNGGELRISFVDDIAYMEGSAETVYIGTLDIDLSSL